MRPASLCPDPLMLRVKRVAVEGKKIVLCLRQVGGAVAGPLSVVSCRRVHRLYRHTA